MTHAIGLLVFFTIVWPVDALRQIVGHGTTELWFWIHAAQTVVFAVLAILAFLHLASNRPVKSAAIPSKQFVFMAGMRDSFFAGRQS